MATGRKWAVIVALAVQLGAGAALAESLSGAYLAGRQARYLGDFAAASDYYGRALARDPDNAKLMEAAVLSDLSLGRIEHALPVARAMEKAGQKSQLPQMVLLADEVFNARYDAVLTRIKDGRGVGPMLDGLIAAWAELGKGNMSDAIAAFDKMAKEKGQRGFALYHKALALAMVGDLEGADAILGARGPGAAAQTRRGVIARIEVLSQLERDAEAVKVLDAAFGDTLDPELTQMRAALVAGKTLDFDIVASARDGIAEVFYTIAGALRGEARDADTILFARLADYLRPDHVDAQLLTAEILEDMKQYDLAIETFRKVPRNDPAFHAAELGRANALRKAGKADAAVEVLQQLEQTHGDLPIVPTTLGDLMRSLDRYGDAINAYDKALDLIPKEAKRQWFIHYARGISYERTGNWTAAEADFRRALKLDPGRPEVLNYLGYSLVDKNRKLGEALGMIEQAAAEQPDSGYIIDSLGWALYRMGRYKQAVAHMERAAELMSVDPLVNDHLGDVYWAVGRHREAKIQWQRALSFVEYGDNSEDVDPERIRRKIAQGLDAVRAEDGEPPLTMVGDVGSKAPTEDQ
ncbi:tetratricopeptide repeat protein [Aquicoccus sp. G2-2]|uniref:tetratricopeptide repeat protein n=1 Tax=Aquicoccus sp. G2-2 TaxID=3092120 RepID=UPI002AE00ABF|nr:tetratricopeptide repeat protein [Aquicoccus sp. G2-2]MEA1113870.1 tetratricopeptide repeat protein [Aquicoccus sp. G2-2]